MPSRKAKKKRTTASELKTYSRIQIPPSLYPALIPDHAGIMMRAYINYGKEGVTPWICHKETHYPWMDCVIVSAKLEALGMLEKVFTPPADVPAGMSIYTINPTIVLETDATKTRKRKRSTPKLTTLSQLNTWLKGVTGKVTIA